MRPGRETREERRPGRGRAQSERPWQLQRRLPEQGLAVRLGVLRQRRAAVLAQLQGEPRGSGKLQQQAWLR